jgi:CRISPR/Cas system CSM-associated protein Csm5 (group 7 of RAMP superfamily)
MDTDIKSITGKTSKIEKETFSIVPFTPVFVGSGSKYHKGIDFYSAENRTCLFNHQKIYSEFLEDIKDLEKALIRASLKEYLEERGKSPGNYIQQQMLGDVKGRDLAVPITDGFKKPIIPGSSLKGSIRTALFADLFKKENLSAKKYGQIISGGKVGDNQLIKKLLSTYHKKKKGSVSNYDIGRVLRISDAPFKQENLEVFNITIANETNRNYQWKSFGGGRKNTINLSEATQTSLAALSYDPDITDSINFSISIDRSALKSIGWQQPFTFKTIAIACNKLSKRLISLELEYLKDAVQDLTELDIVIEEYKYLLEDVKASISEIETDKKISWFQRVGWGSGWLGMSGAHAYDEDKNGKEYMAVLRNQAEFMFKRTKDFVYPKTRKIVLDRSGKPAISMGWVYIEMQP